jgi:hypothetical protein
MQLVGDVAVIDPSSPGGEAEGWLVARGYMSSVCSSTNAGKTAFEACIARLHSVNLGSSPRKRRSPNSDPGY